METSVYVDLFFLINFSMDFLCLFLTSKLLSKKFSLPRCLSSAIFGGIYANIALFLSVGRISAAALDLLACVLLCSIAFLDRKNARRMPLYILIYVAISMVLGGFMTGLFNIFNRMEILQDLGATEGDGISVWLFAVLAVISAFITLIGGRFFSKQVSRKQADVSFTFENKTLTLCALADSGNLLKEPISGKPCIIADIDALSPILPSSVATAARSSDISRLCGISDTHRKRLSILPATTVSGDAMLVGIRMDSVSVSASGKSHEVDVIVALSKLKNKPDGCSVILPSALLAG